MRRRSPMLVVLLLAPQVASAGCDLPTIGPTDVTAGLGDSSALRIITGVAGICDPTARSFAIDLPDLRGIRTVSVQLSLAGFTRHYGVRQIGFALQGATATPAGKGVTVQYSAAVDGLDRYQLAYTLYIAAAR